ncbi:MAG: sugar transferase [Clostridia bacterium]|nr:sugar transferase [Clostridia bacterium]
MESTKQHKVKGPYEAFFKRLIDVTATGLVLVLFCWVYLILALLVRIDLGSPVFFTQDRVGKDGKIFKMYKFRSMSNQTDENGELLPDRLRLTKFGKFIRATSLDELPELINIFKGDMSLVGPRPLLVSYLEYYNSFEMRRHEVRPGLTGLTQVKGRRGIPWKQKFEQDVEYVDNITFLMDAKIVFLTVKEVFTGEGVENYKENQWIRTYFNEHGELRAGEGEQTGGQSE